MTRTYLDQAQPLADAVFAKSDEARARWSRRIDRARRGVAEGEDLAPDERPRMAQEHAEERAIDKGEMREEDTNVWRIQLSDFGFEGEAARE